MFIVSCRQCGEKFEAKTDRRMYCSKRCCDKGKPSTSGLLCRICGEAMHKGATSGKPGEAAHNSCLRSILEHGTRKGYRTHKCRCDSCVQWNRDQVKAYKLRRQAEGRPLRMGGGGGPYIPELIRRAVYERDDWTCLLCSRPVDRSADPQSDWYPSLDHILPQSKGGKHTLENLRAAHRWCNSVRGDDRFHQDLFV
jgi:5-methylcytosine-specific restriction endonuclease McrA